jgi:hypothetical protein
MKVNRPVRAVRNGWAPDLWASSIPFGLDEQHPTGVTGVMRSS